MKFTQSLLGFLAQGDFHTENVSYFTKKRFHQPFYSFYAFHPNSSAYVLFCVTCIAQKDELVTLFQLPIPPISHNKVSSFVDRIASINVTGVHDSSFLWGWKYWGWETLPWSTKVTHIYHSRFDVAILTRVDVYKVLCFWLYHNLCIFRHPRLGSKVALCVLHLVRGPFIGFSIDNFLTICGTLIRSLSEH